MEDCLFIVRYVIESCLVFGKRLLCDEVEKDEDWVFFYF